MRESYKTNIERIMDTALRDNGINATFQFPIRGSYILDFAITEHKIGIECDGKIWHNKRKDKIRDYWLKKKGWIMLRFTDDIINKDIGKCIDIIKEELKNAENKS